MNHRTKILIIFSFILIGSSMAAFSLFPKPGDTEKPAPVLDKSENGLLDSNEAFHVMMDVLEHKRCMNCHPASDVPYQGEDSHPHLFGVKRGAINCNSCHQSSNNDYSGVPGAPDWGLAPLSMAWEGLSRTEIARSMMDRTKNGNRSAEDIMHHLTEHELVLWAWEPGVNAEGISREIPPHSKEAFIEAVKIWVAAGATIPE